MHYDTHLEYVVELIVQMDIGSSLCMTTNNGWCTVTREKYRYVTTTPYFTFIAISPFRAARRLFI